MMMMMMMQVVVARSATATETRRQRFGRPRRCDYNYCGPFFLIRSQFSGQETARKITGKRVVRLWPFLKAKWGGRVRGDHGLFCSFFARLALVSSGGSGKMTAFLEHEFPSSKMNKSPLRENKHRVYKRHRVTSCLGFAEFGMASTPPHAAGWHVEF